MSTSRTVLWAALVFGLLVLPPAISAGQESALPSTSPPNLGAEEATPAPAPADQPQTTGAAEGESSDGEGEGDDRAEPAADPPSEDSSPAEPVAGGEAGGKPTARFASSLTVSIGDNFYSPKAISIEAGDTVTWVNNGQAQHSATASDGSFDTGIFGPGGSRSHTFSRAGTFDYFCSVHGTSQSGTVSVASASGAGGGGAGRGDSGGGGAGGGGDNAPSEASAVASSGAAGDSNTLPATGADVLLPLGVGLALLLAGLGLRVRDRAGPA